MVTYSLDTFVADLRSITSEETTEEKIILQVVPLAKRLVSEMDWSDGKYKVCDEQQGFGITILNEDTGNALMVETICWLPGRGVAPHDHQTWGVVVGIEGEEMNLNWERHDDGSKPEFADLSLKEELIVGPMEACTFLPNDIHSVRNVGTQPSLSLHIYGFSPGSRNRSEFDPLNQTCKPCPQRVRNRV
ncbi:MAG: hypothetical protein CMM58_12875 [Rhodospirillaceae bacterium]|nr:hypothetical protein [Rhodospirillaceae bacterium]|tara:strand:- start:659 stop:1225 length:567 start_codon:yes stop_codon:yes gene_type:complete